MSVVVLAVFVQTFHCLHLYELVTNCTSKPLFIRDSSHTYKKGTLGIECKGATGVDASIIQEFQQAYVVITVNLQGETKYHKLLCSIAPLRDEKFTKVSLE